MEPRNRLIRTNESNRVLAGVCGGIAAYLAIDPLWIRLAFLALSAASGVGVLSYIILWLIMPHEGHNEWDHFEDGYYDADRFKRKSGARMVIAGAMVATGVLLLLANLGSVASLLAAAVWPLLGLAILVVGLRRLRG